MDITKFFDDKILTTWIYVDLIYLTFIVTRPCDIQIWHYPLNCLIWEDVNQAWPQTISAFRDIKKFKFSLDRILYFALEYSKKNCTWNQYIFKISNNHCARTDWYLSWGVLQLNWTKCHNCKSMNPKLYIPSTINIWRKLLLSKTIWAD